MQIPLEAIIVKKRIRKELGDIAALAESMKRFGQISPILVSNKNELIAGGRRLEAARSLGWRTINATVVDLPGKLAKLEYEVEENIQRRDFNPLEIAQATRRIYKLKHPGFFRRLWNAVAGLFTRLFKIGG
ncbi:MAG: ParB/RepB/Spo0J family partition protein [Treponema sp.]|jgi:ParB family chromosome partitioning protein|nr:ParB/RepB/Spo0J family partition protein [Treponema sp.]